jgi:hypothetical protein
LVSDRIIVGLDAAVAGLDADAIKNTLALLGAEELYPGVDLCTCCGAVTPLKLRDIPFCAPCMESAIEERCRRLRRHPATKTWPFPVRGQTCNRNTCKKAKRVAQQQAEQGELFTTPTMKEM